MQWMNTNKRYGLIARLFHGIMLIWVPLQLIGGFWAASLSDADKAQVISGHKASGLLILIMVLLRMSWRMANVLPEPPKKLTDFQVMVSRTVHRVIYGLLIAMPLSGWAMATLAGKPPVLPGIGKVVFPLIQPRNVCLLGNPYPLGYLMWVAHGTLGVLIALVLLMHMGVGISHYLKKDGIFDRMYFPKD